MSTFTVTWSTAILPGGIHITDHSSNILVSDTTGSVTFSPTFVDTFNVIAQGDTSQFAGWYVFEITAPKSGKTADPRKYTIYSNPTCAISKMVV